MFRGSIQRIVVAGLAAASLTVFAVPTAFAATAEQSPAQVEQEGWCDIVPTFCQNRCNNTARCNPCNGTNEQAVGGRDERRSCALNRE